MSENSVEGIIFNIQRFAIQDGPGIRTTVFFKGCPLHCPWCSNPESLKQEPEIIVRDVRCIKCGHCIEVCSQQAITVREGERILDWEKCDRCLKCVEVCPSHSIERMGEIMTVNSILDIVKRDAGFYRHSNGGMTLSGGEPLLQWQFALEVLRDAKGMGFHTALDTTAYASWEVLDEVMNFTDLLLCDVKHMNSERHQETTGVPVQRILENLQKVAARPKSKIWVRHPLIPNFNDSEEDLEELCKFVRTLGPAVEKLSLLPYHKFGETKYTATGRTYPWAEASLLSDERVEELKQMAEGLCDIKVDAGK